MEYEEYREAVRRQEQRDRDRWIGADPHPEDPVYSAGDGRQTGGIAEIDAALQSIWDKDAPHGNPFGGVIPWVVSREDCGEPQIVEFDSDLFGRMTYLKYSLDGLTAREAVNMIIEELKGPPSAS